MPIRKTAGPSVGVFRVFGKTSRHQRREDTTLLKSKVMFPGDISPSLEDTGQHIY